MNPPNPLTGSNPIVSWANKLRAAVVAQRIRGGRGIRVNQSTDGVTISVEPGGASAPATSTHVEMFLYKSAGTGADADLLKCRTWDGVVEGPTDVWVLKPYKLRKINAQIVGGSTIVYTWDATYLQRTASIGTSIVEVQTIIPRYIAPYSGYAGDIIHAGKLKYPQTVNLQTIEYVDLNVDGRAWAKSF